MQCLRLFGLVFHKICTVSPPGITALNAIRFLLTILSIFIAVIACKISVGELNAFRVLIPLYILNIPGCFNDIMNQDKCNSISQNGSYILDMEFCIFTSVFVDLLSFFSKSNVYSNRAERKEMNLFFIFIKFIN